MKREFLTILVVIAAAVALAVGVNGYLDSCDKTFGELVQDLTEAAETLIASEEAEEEDASAVSVSMEEAEQESVTSLEEEAGEETTQDKSGPPEEEQMPSDAEIANGEESEQAPPDFGDVKRLPNENRNTDWQGVFADEYQIEDFEIIYQMPELPTGCEVVALTMVLHYYGYDVDKTIMASEYLPTAAAFFYYGNDGLKYGPDLNEYFVGDPFSDGGYICGTSAIVTAADSYLEDVGSSLRAVDLTGTSVEELYKLVSEDIPVLVWVTIEMAQRASTSGWYTESGEYVEWSTNDHGAVLIGYTEDTVTIADPISGLVEYSRDAFESIFESRGNQCVILQ